MRRICLSLLVVLLLPVCGGVYNEICSKETGENDAFSFCKEGKTWNYIFFHVEDIVSYRDPYSYVVRGDTVIDVLSYKKIYHQKDGKERLAFMMREDGSKVFKRHPNEEEKLFFDFGRDDVGLVYHWKSEDFDFIANWMIFAIDSVQVNDNLFRRYYCYLQYAKTEQDTVDERDAQYRDYWVEGIGSARYGIEANNLEMHDRAPGVTEYFVSCYENGKCIFTAEDFARPAYTTDMQTFRNSTLQEEPFYNLQGRMLQQTPKKGVVIQNGKKYLQK